MKDTIILGVSHTRKTTATKSNVRVKRLPCANLPSAVLVVKTEEKLLLYRRITRMMLTVADPGFSKWGGAVLSQMGGRTSCFQVKSA